MGAVVGVKRIAAGVWRVNGGFPLPTMNVYLLEEQGGGVTMFDAGVRSMVKSLQRACTERGGLHRIVLGHGHPDHRGAAPGLGAPVFCHADNVADTEGDGGRSYIDPTKLGLHGRLTLPRLLEYWDGGPVSVSGTIAEGEEVCGFTVVDLSGHAPGQIALFRENDGLALVSDAIYTVDPQTGIKGRPRVPHSAFNLDERRAHDAVAKLAALDPTSVWPGHADPVTKDARVTLEKVAAGG